MSRKRALIIGLAAAVAVLIGVLLSPLASSVFHFAIVEDFSPETISWDGKTAWKRCESAIAGRTSWPDTPQKACAAMHLCANEAALSDSQQQALTRTMRATNGCAAP